MSNVETGPSVHSLLPNPECDILLVNGDNLPEGFNAEVYTTPYTVLPTVRGVSVAIDTSLSSLFSNAHAFCWLRRDPAGFARAAARDPALGNAVEASTEIVDAFTSSGELSYETRRLLSLALTEKMAEVALVAAPYIPKNIVQENQGKEFTFRKEDRGPHESFYEKWKRFLREKIMTRRLPKDGSDKKESQDLPIRENRVASSSPVSAPPREPLSRDNSREIQKPPERVHKHRKYGPVSYIHPLLDEYGRVGRERRWEKVTGNQPMIIADEMMTGYKDKFIVTRIMNDYDPEAGILSVTAKKEPAHLQDRRGYSNSILSAPLGIINVSSFPHIAIPFPVSGAIDERIKRYFETGVLVDVSIQNKKETVLLRSEEVAPFIYRDEVGNYSLALGEMPEELKKKLEEEYLVLFAEFSPYLATSSSGADSPWIGPMPKHEQYRLHLYPKEIAAFLSMLKSRKESKDWKYRDRTDIFIRLAQYVGSLWLTYDKREARTYPNDPVGFQQTERVLARRRASCEGSNIALGQLMRYFLGENEGIAYVEGFVLSQNGVARADDFHLKVAYKDAGGSQHLFDATAWPESYHKHFDTVAKQAREAHKQWKLSLKEAHLDQRYSKTRELSKRADGSMDRLHTSWYHGEDKRKKDELLPGVVEFRNLPRIFEFNPFFPSGSKATPKLSRDDGQNLIVFLKKIHGVDDDLGAFWRTPYIAISGEFRFNLRFLENTFVSSPVYMNVRKYTDHFNSKNKATLLTNKRVRQDIYEKMISVYQHAIPASEQNMAVVDTLTTCIEELSREYETRMKQMFLTVPDKLPTDVDTFFDQAPFLLLLNNPLKELDGFFTRLVKEEQMGFLSPFNADEIKARLKNRLSVWKLKTEQTLESMERELPHAPLHKVKERTTVPVSSLLLWQQITQPAPQQQLVVHSNGEYLDASELFRYLRNKFIATY